MKRNHHFPELRPVERLACNVTIRLSQSQMAQINQVCAEKNVNTNVFFRFLLNSYFSQTEKIAFHGSPKK